MKKIPQDLIGNIAILKFPRRTFLITKKIKALIFLKQHKTITTILEKTDGFSGQLRIPTTKYLAGEKTTIATYKENNCIFKFDINKTYFSPRLSNERKIIAGEIAKIASANGYQLTANAKNKPFRILVMFAGIAPYPIVIAKQLLKAKGQKLKSNFHIYSNELNKEANISAKENICLNKLQNQITIIPGDANRLPQLPAKLHKSKNQQPDNVFDIILMPRPNLKETFLPTALKLSKKETTIFYHGFGTKKEILKEIKDNTKNKIGKIKIRKAGDIGPYAYRWQAQFKVK